LSAALKPVHDHRGRKINCCNVSIGANAWQHMRPAEQAYNNFFYKFNRFNLQPY
jgi:hypothetical protein